MFILLHELAHGITAIIFGGKFKGLWLTSYIGFGKKSNDISAFAFYTYTSYNNNLLCYRSVKIAGSLTAISSASVINYISKKKKNLTLFLATSNVIYYELVYWIISPILKYGDAYQLLYSLKITNLNTLILFSLILFAIFICISIVLIKSFMKLLTSIYEI
ncbi:MAG: hypothetical protein ACFFAH_08605 [Promethearchaeota archaeon]